MVASGCVQWLEVSRSLLLMWKYEISLIFSDYLTLTTSCPSTHTYFSLCRGKIFLDSQASFATLFVRRTVYGLFLHFSCGSFLLWSRSLLQMLNVGFILENTATSTHWVLPLSCSGLRCKSVFPFCISYALKEKLAENLGRICLLLHISKVFTWKGQLLCKTHSSVTQNILLVSRSQSRFSSGKKKKKKRKFPLLQD